MARKIPWGISVLLFVMVMPTLGQPCEGLIADLDEDGAVTFSDFFMLADQFGEKSEVGQVDSLGGEALNLKIQVTVGNYFSVEPLPTGQRHFVVNADGSSFLKLAGNLPPNWISGQPSPITISPDGSKITFSAGGESYLMDFNGSDQIKIADSLVTAVWSPDGSKFAFAQGDRVEIVNRDGSRFAELQNQSGYGEKYSDPIWSPDGMKLLVHFSTMNITSETIYELSNISSPVKLPNLPPEQIRLPIVWSPDGNRLAFWNLHRNSLYTIDADGSTNEKRIYNGDSDEGLRWAEDGRIYLLGNYSSDIIASVKDDGTDFTTHWEGKNETEIIGRRYDSPLGQLSPEATHIAFETSYSVTTGDIETHTLATELHHRFYVKDIDISERTLLMDRGNENHENFQYSWSPSERNIAIAMKTRGNWGGDGWTTGTVIASTDGKESIDLTDKLVKLGNLISNSNTDERIQSVSFHWYTPQTLKADLGQDGIVNFNDFFMLADQFGMTCEMLKR